MHQTFSRFSMLKWPPENKLQSNLDYPHLWRLGLTAQIVEILDNQKY